MTIVVTSHADTSIYEPYCFDTLASGFSEPWGLAVGIDGSIYVADTLNHTIRKTTTAGVVSLLAGSPGNAGFADGAGLGGAMFSRPTGVAVDAGGNVYVADYNNHRIRMITPGGFVSTVAGSGNGGSADGTGIASEFRNPFGVALNSAGTLLYVSDQNNQTIRSITLPGGVVTTYAGLALDADYVNDGNNLVARFNAPRGIAVDAGGNVFVADAGNLVVRKIAVGGGVTTFAGDPGVPFLSGFNDGPGIGARFSDLLVISPFGGPCGVAVDSLGNVYVSDQGHQPPMTGFGHTIRKITPAGNVTTLGGVVGVSGSTDGTGILAKFNSPAGVAVDSTGKLFVADTSNHLIRVQRCCGKPDVAVGATLGTLRGVGLFSPTPQRVVLTSRRVMPVNALISIANLCDQLDAVAVSATRGNRFFDVIYRGTAGNLTASLVRGSYRTVAMDETDARVAIRAKVEPNRKKLTVKRGRRMIVQKKSISLRIRANSTFDMSAEDTGTIQVQMR